MEGSRVSFSAAIREAKSSGRGVLDMGESPFARVCQNGGEDGRECQKGPDGAS